MLRTLGYAFGLAAFLRRPKSSTGAAAYIQANLAGREAAFLSLMERAVYGNGRSPFRPLLLAAGFELPDVAALIGALGLEGALGHLYDAGVYVTYEEARGRKPIRRLGLDLQVKASDFANPLLGSGFGGKTSGSRGERTRMFIDLARLDNESRHLACMLEAHDVGERPIAVWRPQPPDSTGLGNTLRYLRIGGRPVRWWSQAGYTWSREGLRSAFVIAISLLVSRCVGRPVPRPSFLPRDRAIVVARWLAEQSERRHPALLDTSPSGATRVCLVAKEEGLDISGTVFVAGGEPFTQAKLDVILAAGARAIDRYSLTEAGAIGFGCARPSTIDDLHFATDKVAVIQRPKLVGESGETVPGLVLTTLSHSVSRIMLNTENGDFGTLETRDCGCYLGTAGLTTHLTNLSAYDKLTSEGVTFMGSELTRLVEELLPARFGGYPTSYQLVEEEVDGLTRVSIVVAPEVGEVDDAAVIEAVTRSLQGYYRGGALMTDQWRQGQTLRVLRRDPYDAGGRKILPLYVLKASEKQR